MISSSFPELSSESRTVMSYSLQPHGLYSPWNSLGQNTGVGSLSLPQGIFPIQRSNAGLLYCRQILYQLSHKRSSGVLEWVAYPFSNGSSQSRNWTNVYCITGGFFTNWGTREEFARTEANSSRLGYFWSLYSQDKIKAFFRTQNRCFTACLPD